MRTLHLTSPTMKGPDVAQAQRALSSSKYGDFHPGPVDGEFGPMTAAACKRAKRWTGYPAKRVGEGGGIYGGELNGYLTGRRALPATYRARRRYRLWRSKPLRVRAYSKARSQLGVKESPRNSNNVLYTRWYLDRSVGYGAWCAMFVTWCYRKAEAPKDTFVRGDRWAYVPYMLADARAGRHGLRVLPASKVQRGDLVIYDWEQNGRPDHVGLFEGWVAKPQSFTAIEGNTSPTSDSNGGEVMRRARDIRSVAAFVRVE